jgi:hypothetical protein
MAFLKAGMRAGTGTDANAAIGKPDGGSFAKVLEMYAAARISKSKQYASLAVGSSGANIRGQVIGLAADTNSTEGNIQAFTLMMKLTDVQGGIVTA